MSKVLPVYSEMNAPNKLGQVGKQLEEQGAQISALRANVELLEDRLGTILRPGKDDHEPPALPDPGLVSLAVTISECNYTLALISKKLNEMIDRIEL